MVIIHVDNTVVWEYRLQLQASGLAMGAIWEPSALSTELCRAVISASQES